MIPAMAARRLAHMLRLGLPLWLLVLSLALPAPALPAAAGPWSPPLALADPAQSVVAAAPALAVDGEGGVHVIWYSVLSAGDGQGGGLTDALVYRGYAGGVWSLPEPIYTMARPLTGDTSSPVTSDAAANNPIFAMQGAVASAPDGRLHIVVSSSRGQSYISAPWRDVVREALLLPPTPLSDGSAGAIASADDGALHVVFAGIPGAQAEPAEGSSCALGCQEILYRRSADRLLWARPENLSRLVGVDASPQVVADARGGVHLLWEHTELTQSAEPYQLYRHSADGGLSWDAPVRLGAPGEGSAQGALGVGPGGQVLAVYGGTRTGSVFFQSSADGGASWSPPGLIPGVLSGNPGAAASNRFSLAADGAGRLHLLMVGTQPAGLVAEPQLLLLSWDGQAWSAPAVVPSGGPGPAAPQLWVSRGNSLHAVWSTTETMADETSRQMVWYSSAPLDAPETPPAPTFTPLPVVLPTAAPTAQPTPTATALPAELRSLETLEGPPRWEGESLPILFIAVGPAVLLLSLVVWWASRRGRAGG